MWIEVPCGSFDHMGVMILTATASATVGVRGAAPLEDLPSLHGGSRAAGLVSQERATRPNPLGYRRFMSGPDHARGLGTLDQDARLLT